MPLSQYSPRVGVSRQPRMFMSVDLPEPDGPMMARYWFRGTTRSSGRSAWTISPPIANSRVTPCTRITSADPGSRVLSVVACILAPSRHGTPAFSPYGRLDERGCGRTVAGAGQIATAAPERAAPAPECSVTFVADLEAEAPTSNGAWAGASCCHHFLEGNRAPP